MDFILDSAGKHTLSVRGTLSNANQDQPNALAQFPGQRPASELLNNSKGMAATYTAILTPSLINSLVLRLHSPRLSLLRNNRRQLLASPSGRVAELRRPRQRPYFAGQNVVDTLTWTKGKHTITTGLNFRIMTNNKFTYSKSYPTYGFSANVAVGLGEDIQTDLTNYMSDKTGNANFGLANHTPTRRRWAYCWGW